MKNGVRAVLEIAAEELKRAAIDFYTMSNIKIVLYDADRTVLYSYPATMCTFCSIVRSNPALAEKCLRCDNVGFDQCEQTRKPYIYKCHMQLTEAIAPICENGIIIGYMMLGQLLEDGDLDAAAAADRAAAKYGLDGTRMKKELERLRPVSNAFISSAVSMMSMCACYLYVHKIIQKHTDVLALQLKDYIESHLSGNLSAASVCKRFFLSKSKLYRLSSAAFGMGISDYVRLCRIDAAKKLLKESEKSISQIAADVGFQDANYFARIFKAYAGRTPRDYRNGGAGKL